MQQPDWRPVDFDGLVVEDERGNRLLALPAAVLPVLRSAAVIRVRRGDSMFSMRLDAFTDGRTGGQPIPQQVPNAPRPAPTSAPTPEYGAPALPVHGAQNPSPAPPPLQEGDPLDPANIPMRVFRDGRWQNVYVTRAEYEQHTQHTEGNQQ